MTVSRATLIKLAVLVAVLAVATALRVVNFPSRYNIRDMDETGYCQGSLQLIEGITPGNKAAPGGPLIWAGWVYLAGETTWNVIAPEKPAAALELRPFVALDRVLFDNCRDVSALRLALVGLNVLLALGGAAAGVGLGIRFSGVVGGLMVGGLFAGVPVFLDLSEMCRPYSMAWSFGMIALFFASSNGATGRRWIWTAVFLGLSIGSRIDMLCLIPLVWWVFHTRRGEAKWKLALLQLTLLSLCVAVFVAPWLMTHLIGNLRTIATVRFAGGASQPLIAVLVELMVHQGMGLVIGFALVGAWFQPAEARIRSVVLAIYAMLLTISMMRGFADGSHQHGAVFISWFLLLAAVTGSMLSRWPKGVVLALMIALAFPLVQSVRLIRFNQSTENHEEAVAWVERHVPAGTTVYLIEGGARTLLPTPESSNALWSEVTDDQAWRKKMESGLSRFGLSANELPRALSEENLIQERGNRRKWFILGGHTDLPVPRYNIRIVRSSPVFGIRDDHDLESAMKSQGGVLLWRDGFHVNPPAFLGLAVTQWGGVRVYCSPEVRQSIH